VNAIAIIPARGGSTRIPRKNIRLFHGKPIIAYSIEAALNSGLFDTVAVSTEDPEIAQVAARYGAWVYPRPARLSQNHIGTQEVMESALLHGDPSGDRFPFACCIYPTAPMIDIEGLTRGLTLLKNSSMNYAFSVGTEPALHDAGQWYWGHWSAFVKGWPLIEALTYMVPIAPERDCDINTEADWTRAERMYAALNLKEKAA
jgi:N-acylneuraminate cytidylyltransferase